MLQGRVQVLLLLFTFTVKVNSAPHGDRLRGELIRDDDLAHVMLVQFLSELMAMNEDDAQPRLEEQVGIRETVMRRQLPDRERPPGCRNFFWKTFTSC